MAVLGAVEELPQPGDRGLDVAGLRALTDDELIRRHDAAVAQGGDAGARSTIYLDELRARVAEQQVEAVMRRLLAILAVTGLALVAAVVTMILVL